jgi:hypothetical protein
MHLYNEDYTLSDDYYYKKYCTDEIIDSIKNDSLLEIKEFIDNNVDNTFILWLSIDYSSHKIFNYLFFNCSKTITFYKDMVHHSLMKNNDHALKCIVDNIENYVDFEAIIETYLYRKKIKVCKIFVDYFIKNKIIVTYDYSNIKEKRKIDKLICYYLNKNRKQWITEAIIQANQRIVYREIQRKIFNDCYLMTFLI